MKRTILLPLFVLFVSSLPAQLNISIAAGPAWYGTYADQVSEIHFLAGGGQSRSTYNIAESIPGLNIALGLGYKLNDRWSIRFHGSTFNGETTYFEESLLLSGDIRFEDFDAPAEMQTINLGLGVAYRIIQKDKISADLVLGPSWNRRSHEYMAYQEYENNGESIEFLQRQFVEQEVNNLGGFLEARVAYEITTNLDLILSSGALFLDDSDTMFQILVGGQYSLSK